MSLIDLATPDDSKVKRRKTEHDVIDLFSPPVEHNLLKNKKPMRQIAPEIKNVGRKLLYENVIEEDGNESPAIGEEFVNILLVYFEGSPSGLASTQSNVENILEERKIQYNNVIEEDEDESPPTKMTGEEFVNILSSCFEDNPSGLAPTQSNVLEESSKKGNDAVDEKQLFDDLEEHLKYEESLLPPLPYSKFC